MWTRNITNLGILINTIILIILCTIPHEVFAELHYGEVLCQSPGYSCLTVPSGDSWESLFPNDQQRALEMRINRMNTEVYGGMMIAVPQNVDDDNYMDYSPFPMQTTSYGRNVIIVDPRVLAWAAYDSSGTLVRWGPAVLGRDYCSDIHHACHTPIGRFTVKSLGSSDCVSSKFPIPYGGAPMPFCMYFHGGYALHASYEVPGYLASHGCVRMFYEDAEWLNHDFVQPGTLVIIKPYGPYIT